ncbi:MAG: RimK family alpha-L-glutamate ligase [Methanothrix sp.]|uniref:Tetrahydromethanopterin:alpha-L-glutamate ligase n=1 Tax=Methanothrix harundinacea TaxID=301375 RepID=A0A101FRS9_9EURY|nr:MAG: Tetrahydromethanopterin:alpha-L-glutamate ligase [Methanothrix harundinacea]KUK94088.1 MAG: Tetrahydromethanopterin:alpha-L-glutamate ligase [Methanothrix harundinacea]MDD5768996.1 RimK family alpha-L-glutamate ligase [Methanothrix sp.]
MPSSADSPIYPGRLHTIMRFGIVVTDPDDWTARAIRDGLTKLGAKSVYLNFSQLAVRIGPDLQLRGDGFDLQKLDGLVVRDLGRSGAHDVAFRFEVLSSLQELGLLIINPPQAISRAANKFAASIALHQAKIPHPKTLVTTSLSAASEFVAGYGRTVSKPLFGYKGRGLALLTRENLGPLQETLARSGVVYLQEFLESTASKPRDIRVFVVGEKVAGAIYRVAPPGSWISNLSQGGAPERCSLTDEIEDLALRANEAMGTVYSGVDLIETAEGLKVLEVNGTPSGRGVYQAWGIDAGEMIAEEILEGLG